MRFKDVEVGEEIYYTTIFIKIDGAYAAPVYHAAGKIRLRHDDEVFVRRKFDDIPVGSHFYYKKGYFVKIMSGLILNGRTTELFTNEEVWAL